MSSPVQINSLPTISMTSARTAWRGAVLVLWHDLHQMKRRAELRQWAKGKPVMMAINEHLHEMGVTATLDLSNRDMVFRSPDGRILDRFTCGYIIYRCVIADQNEAIIPKYW